MSGVDRGDGTVMLIHAPFSDEDIREAALQWHLDHCDSRLIVVDAKTLTTGSVDYPWDRKSTVEEEALDERIRREDDRGGAATMARVNRSLPFA